MRNKAVLVYPELSYILNGLFYNTHNELNRFCLEKQYADLLEIKFKENNMSYEREKQIPFNISEKEVVKGNRVDFCVESKILVDLKAKKFITKEDYYQMKRYLMATGLKLGVIVNFRDTYIKPHRILNSNSLVDSHLN